MKSLVWGQAGAASRGSDERSNAGSAVGRDSTAHCQSARCHSRGMWRQQGRAGVAQEAAVDWCGAAHQVGDALRHLRAPRGRLFLISVCVAAIRGRVHELRGHRQRFGLLLLVLLLLLLVLLLLLLVLQMLRRSSSQGAGWLAEQLAASWRSRRTACSWPANSAADLATQPTAALPPDDCRRMHAVSAPGRRSC
jgi:hypothetical protein